METIRHGMNGFRIPAYMEEILTHNYCPCFVRMSMIRDGQSYRFSYRPGKLTRLDSDSLDTYGRLMLLRSLITMNEAAESYLIGAENYLLEPELVYTTGDCLSPDNIRILFYPDAKKLGFAQKLMLFTERINSGNGKDERDILGQLRDILESRELNRAKMFLDKNILRIENRTLGKAG